MQLVIPHHLFTYSRRAHSHMVCEESTLRGNVPNWPRNVWPERFTVEGKRQRVDYRRCHHRDVMDAGYEDLVAAVYLPENPAEVGKFPQVHVLND